MDFDPSTAVIDDGFDPSSATPVVEDDGSFDAAEQRRLAARTALREDDAASQPAFRYAGSGRDRARPAPAPAPVREPPPAYRDRREAIDDAVNLIEEGAPEQEVVTAFARLGVTAAEIRAAARARVPGGDGLLVAPAQLADSGTITAVEPGSLRQIGDVAVRGAQRTGQAFDVLGSQLGTLSPETAARRFVDRQRTIDAAAPTDEIAAGMAQIGRAQGFGEAAAAMARNPLATLSMLGESVVASAPGVFTAIAGSAMGPWGTAAGAGVGSLATEYASSLVDYLQDKGMDPRDARNVQRALSDPAMMAEARGYAAKRGLPVAAFDALSAGVAGRFIGPAIQSGRGVGRAALKEAGTQIGAGMAGEAVAQDVTGQFKPADILLEGLAELPGSAVEVASNVLQQPVTPVVNPAGEIVDRVFRSGKLDFTPPDSPSAQAGLTPISVPIQEARPDFGEALSRAAAQADRGTPLVGAARIPLDQTSPVDPAPAAVASPTIGGDQSGPPAFDPASAVPDVEPVEPAPGRVPVGSRERQAGSRQQAADFRARGLPAGAVEPVVAGGIDARTGELRDDGLPLMSDASRGRRRASVMPAFDPTSAVLDRTGAPEVPARDPASSGRFVSERDARAARRAAGQSRTHRIVAVDDAFVIEPRAVRREPEDFGDARRREFLREVRALGGVNADEISDILGERNFRAMPGLFRRGGRGVDLLVHDLTTRGYLPDGLDEIEAAERVRELVRDAVSGEAVMRLDELDEMALQEYERRMQSAAESATLADLSTDTLAGELDAGLSIDALLQDFDDAAVEAIVERAAIRSESTGEAYEDAIAAEVAARKDRRGGARTAQGPRVEERGAAYEDPRQGRLNVDVVPESAGPLFDRPPAPRPAVPANTAPDPFGLRQFGADGIDDLAPAYRDTAAWREVPPVMADRRAARALRADLRALVEERQRGALVTIDDNGNVSVGSQLAPDVADNIIDFADRHDLGVIVRSSGDGPVWETRGFERYGPSATAGAIGLDKAPIIRNQVEWARNLRGARLYSSRAPLVDEWRSLARAVGVWERPARFAGVEPALRRAGFSVRPLSQAQLRAATRDAQEWGIDRVDEAFEATVGEGVARITRAGEFIWADLSGLAPGQNGAAVLDAAADWAHSSGRTLIGDPAGAGPVGTWRSTEAHLRSALKYGTTRHLEPSQRQLGWDRDDDPAQASFDALREPLTPLADWGRGDAADIAELMRVTAANVRAYVPEIDEVRVRDGRFVDRQGRVVTDERLGELVARARRDRPLLVDPEDGPLAPPVGVGTLKRAVISRMVLNAARWRSASASASSAPLSVDQAERVLRAALGPAAARIELLESGEAPVDAEPLVSGAIEGFHDSATDRTVIFVDAIGSRHDGKREVMSARQRLLWVAHHELFHRGVTVKGGTAYRERLTAASLHPVVQELAVAISVERSALPRTAAVEEALAELAAAQAHGDFADLRRRYGVVVEPGTRIARVIQGFVTALRRFIDSVIGRKVPMTTADVLALVRELVEAGKSIDTPDQGERAVERAADVEGMAGALGSRGRLASTRETFQRERQRFDRPFVGQQRRPGLKAGDLRVGSVKSGAGVDLMTRWVDAQFPILNAAREAGDAVGERLKLAIEAYPGRVSDRLDRERRAVVEPFTQAMGAAAKRLRMRAAELVDAYGLYRYALHAEERNAELRRRGSEAEHPSGMSAAEARRWLAYFRSETAMLAEFKALDEHVSRLQKRTDEVRLGADVLTPEMIAARPRWAHYVSLQGDPFDGDEQSRPGGAGWREEDIETLGRDTLSLNPVVNTVRNFELAIKQAEHQRVKDAVIDFVKKHGALIDARIEPLERGDDARGSITFWDGDQRQRIVVGDRRFLAALRGLNITPYSGIEALMAKGTFTLGRLYTQFSPHFPLFNFLRDMQQQVAQILGTEVRINGKPVSSAAIAARIISRLPATFGAAVSEVLGRKPAGKYTRAARELIEQGGLTGFSHSLSDVERVADFVAEVRKKAGQARLARSADAFIDVVAGITDVFELTARVAVYSSLRDMGMDAERGANFAKNLMNFNKAGTQVRRLAPWYMFIRPAFQDLYKTSQLLRTRKGAAVAFSMFLGAVALYSMLRALSGSDDDDEDKYALDRRNPGELRNFIVLPLGGAEPVRIPVGFGLPRITWGLAVTAVNAVDNPDWGATQVADSALKSFTANMSPIQLSEINAFERPFEWGLTTFAPSITVPMVELAINRTRGDVPITSTNRFDARPDSAKGRDNTPEEWKDAARLIFDGTDGRVDVAPETLAYMFRQYGGGPAGVIAQWLQRREKERGANPVTARDFPVVGAFIGPRERYVEREFRRADEETSRLIARFNDLRQRDPRAAAQLLDDDATMAKFVLGKEIDAILKDEARFKAMARRIPDGRERRITLREIEETLKQAKRDALRRHREAQP